MVCDEFGYVSCNKEAGELLFNHLSLRAEDRSTIITTNLAFDRWGEIIRDKVLVAAMIDRLTQRTPHKHERTIIQAQGNKEI